MILSLQLYSLRDFMDFEASLQFCAAKGLRYVEPAGLYGYTAAEVVAKLEAAGLRAQSFHFGMDVLQRDWQVLAQTLPACGAKDLVMPFADVHSLAELKLLAAGLQEMAVKLQGQGIQLHYHNHAHELAKVFEGQCFLDWLLQLAPALHWQVDVGWVCAGGADVAQKMNQWQRRISMLHIKDILLRSRAAATQVTTQKMDGVEVVVGAAAAEGGQPARMGEGIVDFASIFAKARELGIQTFILENDKPADADAFADSGIALIQKYTQRCTQ